MAQIITQNGSIFTSGSLNITSYTGSMTLATSASTVINAFTSSNLQINGTSLVFLTGSNVGISNTNPQYPLDVTGNIHSSQIISASAFTASNGFYGTSSWSSQALTASYLTSVTNPYTITASWAQSASNAINSQTASYLTGGNVIASNISSSGTLFVQGNTTLAGNLTVLGTSSVINITSSVIIGGNKVVVNAYSPFQRYAGLSAYDSGSANNYSSSIYWDSLNNAWIIQGTGELTDAGITSSAVLIGGPISTFGSEGVLTVNTIPKAQTGGVNLANSLLTDNGTTLAYTGAGGISSSIITASIHYGSAFSSSVTNAIGFYGTSSWSTTSSYASGSGVFALSSSYALNSTNSTSASYVSGNVITSNLNSTGVASFTNITSSGTISASAITASSLYVANAIVATSFTGAFSGSIGNAVNAQTASYLNGYANIPVSLATGSVSAYQFNLSGSATTGSNTFGNINVRVSTGSAYGLVINATSGVSGSAYAISASNGIIIGTTISASNLFISGNEVDLGNITAGTINGTTSITGGAILSTTTVNVGTWLINASTNTLTNSNVIGVGAGNNFGGTYNNFFGYQVGGGVSTTANYNNFIGYNAGYFTSLTGTISGANFIGQQAGQGANYASYSNFIGYQAGYGALGTVGTPLKANFIGYQAGYGAANAVNSIFLGQQAGYNDTISNGSTNSSILIGDYTGTGGNTDSISIGRGTSNSAASQANIGNVFWINGIRSTGTTPTNTAITTAKIGIGTNTPNSTLSVVGNISASSITASTYTGTAYSSSATNAVGFYGTSSWAVTASYAIGSLAGGTTNYVPLWTSTTTLSTSSIYQSASSVAINNTTFNSTAPESLLVSGSTFNVISGYGNLNSYIQLNIKNSNSGATGSSDIVATADNGTETQYYVDLGINSSQHTASGDVGQANDGYLYNTGSNFYIGNITPNKNLYFFAGSPTNTSSMVLTSTSNFGIGITSPVNKLDVGGNISASAITASTFTGTVYSSSTTNAVGYFGTSSYANNATSASYAVTASYSIASANAFLQGGNNFAQSASFGTNDNNILVVKTNNTTRLVVDTNSNLTSSVNIIPSADNTYNLGSSAFRFTGIYAAQSTIGALFETGLTTVGISSLSTGTVLTWRNGKLIPCDIASDEMVMGVVQNGKDEPIVFGAEPVLVTGVVNEGDYIVTSDKSGHGKGIPRGSVHPIDLFAKVIAQAVESGSGDSYTIKAMIRKM